jgi:hypothetical protein
MKTSTIIVFIFLVCQALAAQDLPAFHAVVSSTRTYMDASRKTESEYWFTKSKTYITNGRITTLIRNDLGVVYTVIVRSNQYYVDSIKPASKEVPEVKKLDFRHLGVDRYAPDYDWTIDRKSGKDTSGLFSSDHYLAEGDADFDMVKLEYWVSKPDDQEMAHLFRDIQLNSMSSLTSRKPLVDLLKKNKRCIPLKIIELIDNPIAPPMLNQIIVEKLESGKAPANIFELPAGAKKGI